MRVIHNEELIHPFQPYNDIATANQIEFFEKVFEIESDIDSYSQTWQIKEAMTLISMIAAMIMLIPISKTLLSIRFFNSLIKPIPNPLPKQNKISKIIFWVIFIIGALIACFSYIPMVDIAKILFPEAANRELTWFYPQRMNNSVMLWAAFNGLVGIISVSYTHLRAHET